MSLFVYLRLAARPEDVAEFEADLKEMDDLSRVQTGYIWSETLKADESEPTYVVLSEWESREDSRAWEHSPRHDEIIDKWANRYAQPFVRRRFTSE